MKKKTRNILIILGIVFVVFAGITIYGIYSVYSFLNQFGAAREIPDEIKEARILTGTGFLTKKEFYKLEKKNLLETIKESSNIQDEKEREAYTKSESAKMFFNFKDLRIFGEEIIAAAEFGGFVFDLNGNLKREIFFEPTTEKIKIGWVETESHQPNLENLKIVELENKKFGFLSYGLMQGVIIFDDTGKQIWTYGRTPLDVSKVWKDRKESQADFEKSHYILEAAVGDLDGDGISEYIVAKKNEGLRVFDRSGNEKWFHADEYPSNELRIVDLDGDGKNELLETGVSSKIRAGNGNVIRELKGGGSDNAVVFVEDRENKKSPVFCNLTDNKLLCNDADDQAYIESGAPLSEIPKKNPKKVEIPGNPEISYMDDSERAAFPKAVQVSFKKDGAKYLAVVAAFIGIPRAHFYLYDEKGNLVYHEILPEEAETIAVLPTAAGNEAILIGGKNTIWRYAAN